MFLYDQCSLHITEKMTSSVKFGGRPRMAWMRSYSSGVSPCLAISSDVMAGSGIVRKSGRAEWEKLGTRQGNRIASPLRCAFARSVRLNRFLASAGLGSRRSVEELIRSGRVRINGHVVTDLATQVQPEDSVKVGSRVVHAQQPIYAVLHKPAGYVCTASDDRDRRTIFDLLPKNWPRVFHVGRLDKESEGLLIITNDGELSLALTHPRFHIEKEYEVGIDKPFEAADREKLLRGFRIEGGWAKAEKVILFAPLLLKLVLRQGIKRQIRLMLYELGYEVVKLRRVRIGALHLGNLHAGEWRLLTAREVSALKQGSGTPSDRAGRSGAPTHITTRERSLPRQPAD